MSKKNRRILIGSFIATLLLILLFAFVFPFNSKSTKKYNALLVQSSGAQEIEINITLRRRHQFFRQVLPTKVSEIEIVFGEDDPRNIIGFLSSEVKQANKEDLVLDDAIQSADDYTELIEETEDYALTISLSYKGYTISNEEYAPVLVNTKLFADKDLEKIFIGPSTFNINLAQVDESNLWEGYIVGADSETELEITAEVDNIIDYFSSYVSREALAITESDKNQKAREN